VTQSNTQGLGQLFEALEQIFLAVGTEFIRCIKMMQLS
jgi:hypothetical protein